VANSRPYFEIANPEIPGILDGLPRGLRVLDVGCGSGVHGAELARIHGHQVTGIDLSESSISKAGTRLARAQVADVTKPEQYTFAGRDTFDVLLFSDMLEHLTDPLDVLSRHLAYLAPGGVVVIAIPNVAIWNVRLSLLFGRFNYTDTGTLDRTHMRFFTRGSLREFLDLARLQVLKSRITPGIARPFVPIVKKIYARPGAEDSESIMQSLPYRSYLQWIYPIENRVCTLLPGLFAFQFVTLARPLVAARNSKIA
jgi:SAM-dependent methyltransferase